MLNILSIQMFGFMVKFKKINFMKILYTANVTVFIRFSDKIIKKTNLSSVPTRTK